MTDRPKAKIQIIEDEAGFRRVYRDILENDGYRVVEAVDGAEGLSQALLEKPDLILLDLILPKVPGLEILKQLRANPETAKTPVIILSVLGDQADIRKGLAFGATGYVVKGSSPIEDILEQVEDLLQQKGK